MQSEEKVFVGLVASFYTLGVVIAFYIKIRKVALVRQIQKTGRVISLSQTIINMLMHELQNRQGNIVSPSGMPPPPPYVIDLETQQIPPESANNNSYNTAENRNDRLSSEMPSSPPPYSELPSYIK